MKLWSCLAVACVFTGSGCAGILEPEGSSSAAERDVGTLQLSLTGTDSKNQQYRLREATFAISGTRYDTYQAVSTTVSSEDDLESPALRTRLFYGTYYVSPPTDGWYIERIGVDGPERVQRAALLTPSAQYVNIQQGGVSQVGFQFGVDGELIDFLGGDLDIGIGIQNAPVHDAGAAGN